MTAPQGEAGPRPLHVAAGDGGWTYVWDHRRKPHLHPVATPAGLVLTRVEPPDHPWQRGVWFVVKFVDGDNFWEEGGAAGWGVQRHEQRPQLADGVVEGELVWIRPDRTTVAIRERRRLRHVDLAAEAFAVDWDVTLRAPRDAVLDRSPYNGQWGGYSGLAFRGRDDWRDTRLMLDDGESRDRVAPRRSRWCDLSGPVGDVGGVGGGGGAGRGGVCLLDHPDNPSHPVPFYATCRAGAGYGEGWANTLYPAFLWDGPVRLAAGDPLRFRYRMVVHDGVWDAGRCAAAWDAFAAAT